MLEYHTSKSVVTVISFLGGYVKDRIFVPSLPRDLADLKARIIAAVKNIDAPMLTRVCAWQELKYGIDVCRVTRGAHIEHIWLSNQNFFSFPVAVNNSINPLNPELNPICCLLALLGANHFLHVNRIRVKTLTLRLLLSYIYIYRAPFLDVSRSHTTTQHGR